MKKLVEDVNGEVVAFYLNKLMGETVTLFCINYIYTGKLIGANDTCVLLGDAKIVYETGPLDSDEWTEAEALPGDWFVSIAAIESFGRLK